MSTGVGGPETTDYDMIVTAPAMGAVGADYDLVVTAPRIRDDFRRSYSPADMPAFADTYNLNPLLLPPTYNEFIGIPPDVIQSEEDAELLRKEIAKALENPVEKYAKPTRKGRFGRFFENTRKALEDADYDPKKLASSKIKDVTEGTPAGRAFEQAEDVYEKIRKLPETAQEELFKRYPTLEPFVKGAGGIAGFAQDIVKATTNPFSLFGGALRRDFMRDNPNPGSVIVEDRSDPPQYGPPAPPAYETVGPYGIPVFESMPIGMNTGGEVSYYMSPPAPPSPPVLGGFDPSRGY